MTELLLVLPLLIQLGKYFKTITPFMPVHLHRCFNSHTKEHMNAP